MYLCSWSGGSDWVAEWHTSPNTTLMAWFSLEGNQTNQRNKSVLRYFPLQASIFTEKAATFSVQESLMIFLGVQVFWWHTHTHHLIYCKGFQGFHFPFPLAVMTGFHKFPGLWVNDFNGEKLHHQGLAFLFAWSPQGARNNKKIYWMRYFFDFFFRTSRTLVFGAMSLCSKILENISHTSGFPNLTFNKCRLHFEDWSILCFHQNPG